MEVDIRSIPYNETIQKEEVKYDGKVSPMNCPLELCLEISLHTTPG